MHDPRARERIGYALRALAADLAAARRQVLILRRENGELRAKLAALQATARESPRPANDSEPGDTSPERNGKARSTSRRRVGSQT